MDLWVFGYGSLLWNPGFTPAEAVTARLEDYRRAFCMLSIHHRGTPEAPGLVLALDAAPGAHCTGVALRVAAADSDTVLAELRARELVSSAYVERQVPLALTDGRTVTALAYVIERDHAQYCTLTLEEQAQRIAAATGGRGPNTEYLHNTVAHLAGMGIHDPDLDWIDARVREIRA